MQYVIRPMLARRVGVKYLTNYLKAQHRAFFLDSRTQHETLPDEELRRDEHKTYRIRKHGKTELPLPPLLDPILHESRMRYTRLEQKQKGEVPKTSLEKELAANPYAQALLGPIRQCRYTRAILPTHFLKRLDPVLIHHTAGGRVIHQVSEEGSRRSSSVKIESCYLLNKASIFKQLTKSGATQLLTSQAATEQIAFLLQRGVSTPQLDEESTASAVGPQAVEQDAPEHQPDRKSNGNVKPVDRAAVFESMLLEKAQQSLAEMQKKKVHLMLSQDEAIQQIQNIIAFVRPRASAMAFEVIHGKPCYVVPASSTTELLSLSSSRYIVKGAFEEETDGSGGTSDEIVGIVKHRKTFELMLALDRLFAYKELYYK